MTGREFNAWLRTRRLDKVRASGVFGVHKRTVFRWCEQTRVPKVVELACRGVEAQRTAERP